MTDELPRKTRAMHSILSRIEDHSDVLSVPIADSRIAAACALMRAVSLAQALLVKHEHGRADSGGLEVRAIFEMWAHGLWLLAEPEEAMEVLQSMYATSVEHMVETALFDHVLPSDWPSDPRRISMKAVLERLDTVERFRDDIGRPLTDFYDVLYRGESTNSAHGLGPLLNHMADVEGVVCAIPLPLENLRLLSSQLLSLAVLIPHLAYEVFREFGYDAAELKDLAKVIILSPNEDD